MFYGEVQFVGFRFTASRLAKKLGLTGFVENLPDGSVIAEAQGKPSLLRKFLITLKSQPHIHITKYKVSIIDTVENESRFSVAPEHG